jgi:hypothetical protein
MSFLRTREHLTVLWFAVAALIAVAVNFAWEIAQAYLYAPMGGIWQATRRCLIASLVDGAIVVLVSAVAGRPWMRRRPSHVVVYATVVALALGVAAAIELWGLAQGRWVYRPEMPRVPGTALGLMPLLQMAVLTPMTIWLADRTTAGA